MSQPFSSYNEWRTTMIERDGLTIDRASCGARHTALEDVDIAETKLFIQSYGAKYQQQVVAWPQKTPSE